MQAFGNVRKREHQEVNVIGGQRPSGQRDEDEISQVIVRTVQAITHQKVDAKEPF
jgi:hypothetical protein